MTSDADQQLQRALDLSYAYLNRRDRTVSEIRDQLERKGVPPQLREAAIATLIDHGFLDDARYARLFVSDKRELEQWGSDRIRRGLLARGIDREEIEVALGDSEAQAEPEETELDRALALLRRRFPAPPHDRRERERALGLLLRKGYDSDVALDALSVHARGD